jgi:hypothetical protein
MPAAGYVSCLHHLKTFHGDIACAPENLSYCEIVHALAADGKGPIEIAGGLGDGRLFLRMKIFGAHDYEMVLGALGTWRSRRTGPYLVAEPGFAEDLRVSSAHP